MVVGVDPFRPPCLTQQLRRPVGDDLVGVHVGRGARAGLVDVDRELVVEGAGGHLDGGLGDGLRPLRVEEAEPLVDRRRRLLDRRQRPDHAALQPQPRDGEVVDRPLGLRPPVRLLGNGDLAHGVLLDPCHDQRPSASRRLSRSQGIGRRAVDTAPHRPDDGLELGEHAAGHPPPGDEGLGVVHRELGHELAVLDHAGDVREQDQLRGAHRSGHGGGGEIGVDVVGLPGAVGGERGDHGYRGLHQLRQERFVHRRDVADEAEILPRRADALPRHKQVAVVAAEPDGRHTSLVDVDDQVLVELADQDHLRDLERLGVRHAMPVAELGREPQALGERRDLRPAAVHHDRLHADHSQEADVLGEPRRQAGVRHRGTAHLHHHDLAEVLAHVGERVEQDPDLGPRPLPHPRLHRLRHVEYSALIRT